MPDDPNQTKVVTLRLNPDFLDRLDSYAARTRRSRNSAIIFLMEYGMNASEIPGSAEWIPRRASEEQP